MRGKLYYKAARLDGWDFYTGKIINYRQSIGSIVVPPNANPNAGLCAPGVLHASRKPNDVFAGARLPLSLYRVRGIPVDEDKEKAAFVKLEVLEELDPAKVFKWRYAEACSPVHPFHLTPPAITDQHVALLRQWARVGDSVWARVGDSVRARVGDSVWDSVGASVRASVRARVGDSVWARVRARVGDSVWARVRARVGDSVWAYVGYIFAPCVSQWRSTKHQKGEYPFQPAVDLWKIGLVPSFDGAVWRLHGGPNAAVLWTGTV